ncbi:MAG TPA: SDR family oxidoreductase [Gemmataceae bacterium]|jgi:dTDP-4-dehydrorhamnose reductase|nr:SDR family oxidoreductase [Gemmataceae bacterium]
MTLLVTGASGRLGRYVLREARKRNWEVAAWSGRQTGEIFGYLLTPVRLEAEEDVRRRFHALRPHAVLHIAAMANVGDCVRQAGLAEQINYRATSFLAEVAAAQCRFVYVSTDMVFGGDKAPYREPDPTAPLSVYGRTKALAEQAVLQQQGTCVARLSLLFGPSLGDPPMFFDNLLATIRNGQPFSLFTDECRTPLSLPGAGRALCDLVANECAGIWHVGGPERLSRYEFGLRLADYLGISKDLIRPASRLENAAPEPRPADLSLDSSRFKEAFPQYRMQSLEEAFAELGEPLTLERAPY